MQVSFFLVVACIIALGFISNQESRKGRLFTLALWLSCARSLSGLFLCVDARARPRNCRPRAGAFSGPVVATWKTTAAFVRRGRLFVRARGGSFFIPGQLGGRSILRL